MDSPFIIPLAGYALVVLIVAISQFTCLRDKETDTARRLQIEEMEHRRKMQELEMELARVKPGA